MHMPAMPVAVGMRVAMVMAVRMVVPVRGVVIVVVVRMGHHASVSAQMLRAQARA